MPKTLDTTPLEKLVEEVTALPDSLPDFDLTDSKRDALFKLGIAINAVKVVAKLAS